MIGWYAYYSRPGGIGRVLQMGAMPSSHRRVLDHLFADAMDEGNLGLSGQADPAWTPHLQRSRCLFRPGRSWLLVHPGDPGLLRVLASPTSFFSRLEGEGWLRFAF
jgi:hypothetical protein